MTFTKNNLYIIYNSKYEDTTNNNPNLEFQTYI